MGETLNNNGLFDWVVEDETELIPNYVPEDDSLIQEFKFELTSMNENYTAEADPSEEAGQMVFFKLEQTGSDMGQFLEYTVQKCKVIGNEDDNEEYILYNESDNNCGKTDVDAKISKVNDNLFTFEYLLFLFSDGSNRSVYSLICEILLCMA